MKIVDSPECPLCKNTPSVQSYIHGTFRECFPEHSIMTLRSAE